jgi:molybdopterin-guanine dinucleotide biosynthesis protein A
MIHHRRPLTGVVLSGGKSLRMGQNKAFLKIGGVPIIRRILDIFRPLFQEIIIVTNEPDLYSNFDVSVYNDLIPNGGALVALYTGLFHSSLPYSFVVGCDMPYLKASVISYLMERTEGYDVTVPKSPDGLEPLHAIYSKNCMGAIESLLRERKAKVIDFFSSVRVKIIEASEILPLDPRLESFVNLNTREELTRYEQQHLSALLD